MHVYQAQKFTSSQDVHDVCFGFLTTTCNWYFPGLGPTVSELDVSQLPVFPKKDFTMVLPEVKEHIAKNIPG